jgi:hypothetical protein
MSAAASDASSRCCQDQAGNSSIGDCDRRRSHGEWIERVRAALLAAAARPASPLVREACWDEAERAAGERARAAERAWRASAPGDAASVPSCFNAFNEARDRLVDE